MEKFEKLQGMIESNILILFNLIFLYFKMAVSKFKNIHLKDSEVNNVVFLKYSFFLCLPDFFV